MNTIIALVAMIACVVVLTKPWGYTESKKNTEDGERK